MIPNTSGVVMNEPDSIFKQKIHASVQEFVTTLPKGVSGGLLTIATTKGVNLVLFRKREYKNINVEISAWIGKSWGAPLDKGIAARVLF